MDHWWERSIVQPGKLPLLLCLSALIVTFVVVRTITRRIRAGRGHLHDVSADGVHIHHVVPGVILAVAGGLIAFSPPATGFGWLANAAAVVFGVGIGLVLDEFALIVYLHDVYWTDQGRRSVEAVVLVAAFIGMLLVGAAPAGIEGMSSMESQVRWVVVAHVSTTFLLLMVVLSKGKFGTAVAGLFVPGIAVVGALRLARPGSPWARHLYRLHPRLADRASRRADRFDRRWRHPLDRLLDLIGGIN